MKFIFTLVLLIVSSFSALSANNNYELISNQQDPNFGALVFHQIDIGEISSLNESQFARTFPVYFGSFDTKPAAELPALLGEYVVDDAKLIFTPRFPFTQGQTYTAFNVSSQSRYQFTIPSLGKPSSNKVLAIYPSTDLLPANLLKLYVRFEHPMQFGKAYENILLLDGDGNVVDTPFLEIEQELWDSERKMFTLWLDPGRIKRDLSPNMLLGNPLQENNEYQLVIKKQWQDVYQNELYQDVSKRFTVGHYDREQPKESTWRFEYPKVGTSTPLQIIFNESLDYGTLLNGFDIAYEQRPLPFEISFAKDESSILLTPNKPWQQGEYQLFINPKIEDLAGNNLNRLFDTDLSQGQTSEKDRTEIIVNFSI